MTEREFKHSKAVLTDNRLMIIYVVINNIISLAIMLSTLESSIHLHHRLWCSVVSDLIRLYGVIEVS